MNLSSTICLTGLRPEEARYSAIFATHKQVGFVTLNKYVSVFQSLTSTDATAMFQA